MRKLDPKLYPHAAAHLDSLPQGLDSFSELKARSNLFDSYRDKFQEAGIDGADMPEPLAAFLEHRKDDWVPDTVAAVFTLMTRDRFYDSDAVFIKATGKNLENIFKGPLYRAVLLVLSPTLMLMGSRKRWGAFRKGSELTSSPSRHEHGRVIASLTLTHPEGIYAQLNLETFAEAFRVAVNLAGAKKSVGKIIERSASGTTFEISWDE